MEKMPATVVSIDKKNDLCVLRVMTAGVSSIRYLDIATDPPKRGERVYNMAAPYGYFGRNTILLYEGFYSGRPSFNLAFYSVDNAHRM